MTAPAAESLSRPFNFNPGPAALPESVLLQVRDEMPDWRGGVSVLECGHREDDFRRCAHEAEVDLRTLMEIPDDYHVLFLHGGAQLQFAAAPMNLAAGQNTAADYVNSGHWAALALSEARRYLTVNECAAVVDGDDGIAMPAESTWRCSAGAAYLHYTPNETISGLEFHRVPDVGAPLVADMSSVILSRRFAVRDFGLIYACAQKNIGPAGLAVVIVRRDLAERAAAGAGPAPRVMNYAAQAAAGCMVNTPPVFAWYAAGLVLRWLRDNGGVAKMEKQNAEKSAAMYRCIDQSGGFYRNRVAPDWRSRMNITFTLDEPQLEETFLTEAAAAGLTGLRGHRAAGGLRASLYNAVPPAGVLQLTEFMNHFQQTRA